jgi:RHS repeat-associated protein
MSYYHTHTNQTSQTAIQGTGRLGLLEYLPFGELFIEERTTWNTPYKFSGKELDEETGYNYHGSRYLDPGISIWLSVDPLADLFPGYSPYNYALNNPIRLIDPSGMGPIKTPEGEETNVGEGYQATSDGKYLHGEGLPTKVWNPDLDYGPGSGSSGKGGYEDYTGADIDFSSYGGSNASGQGDVNSTNTGTPDWLNTAGRVTAAAGPTNQVKQQLFNYASKTDKAVRNLKYVKGVRNLGTAGMLVGMSVAGWNIATDIQTGSKVNGWDVADLGFGTSSLVLSAVLVANPVGLLVVGTVSTVYFTSRLIHDISNE